MASRRTVLLSLSLAVAPALALAAAVSGGLPPVITHGTIRALVHQRDTAAKVELAEVLRTAHTFGLGSLSDLRGEITIADGTAWLSYPPAAPGDVPRIVVAADSPERAGFLVTAAVDPGRWREVKMSRPISSDNLESVLVKLATEVGLGGADLPFRIEGHFATLTLGITDGRKLPPGPTSEETLKKANYTQTEADVTAILVGFIAAKADQRFTHAGTRIHVHAIVEGRRRMTGHAQSFTAPVGVRLWLPAGSQ